MNIARRSVSQPSSQKMEYLTMIYQSLGSVYPIYWRENSWIHAFLKGINTMQNANKTWTLDSLSISYNSNHYTTDAS